MSSRIRRVAVISGTRAEYGLLRSTLRAMGEHPRIEPRLVVTGMHLLRKFGRTIRDIERDGVSIAAVVKMQRGTDDPLDQAQGLARGVQGIATFLNRDRIDVVLVLGDRVEALAGALAAVTTGRIVAHVHGGDVATGDYDDSVRHAITKLAHVHLAATKSAAARIVRLGEEKRRVHVVGAPGLDELRDAIGARRARSSKRDEALVVHHPIGRSAAVERRLMDVILDETRRAELNPVIVYPNTDRGHAGIIAAIEAFTSAHPGAEAHRSLPRDEYLRRLASARVLIGNSSSGIIEAATAGTPAVNVGDRQDGRERSGRGVIDADESRSSIRAALGRAKRLHVVAGAASVYGDGRAGSRVAAILSRVPLDDAFRRKRITY